jgi:hypothetical protein
MKKKEFTRDGENLEAEEKSISFLNKYRTSSLEEMITRYLLVKLFIFMEITRKCENSSSERFKASKIEKSISFKKFPGSIFNSISGINSNITYCYFLDFLLPFGSLS